MVDFREIIKKNIQFNVSSELQNLSVPEIQQVQIDRSKRWAVLALNLTGDLNVGMIARTACAFGAMHMYVCGRKKIDRRSFVGVENYLPMTIVGAVSEEKDGPFVNPDIVWQTIKDNNLLPIWIEQGGENIYKFDFKSFADEYPDFIPTLVIGNEGEGIDEVVMKRYCDHHMYSTVVSILQLGVTRSLNVSNAFAISSSALINGMGWCE